MARRAFISFDYDNDNDNDARLKDLLVGQAKNSHTPFVIADWSIKEPSADWKDKARRKIRASGLVIVLCGKNMSTANSQPELCSGPQPASVLGNCRSDSSKPSNTYRVLLRIISIRFPAALAVACHCEVSDPMATRFRMMVIPAMTVWISSLSSVK